MSNPYEYPLNETAVEKKGLTWAEWSIIVALFCVAAMFLYAWHAQSVAAKANRDLQDAIKTLADIADVDPEKVKEYINQINSLKGNTKKLAEELSVWQQYADDLDAFVDWELRTYWTRPTYKRPARPDKSTTLKQ